MKQRHAAVEKELQTLQAQLLQTNVMPDRTPAERKRRDAARVELRKKIEERTKAAQELRQQIHREFSRPGFDPFTAPLLARPARTARRGGVDPATSTAPAPMPTRPAMIPGVSAMQPGFSAPGSPELLPTLPSPAPGGSPLMTSARPSFPSLGEAGQRKVTLHQENADAMEILTGLLRMGKASYLIGGEARPGRKISIHFNETPLEDALSAVAEAAGIRYRLHGDVILLSSDPGQVLYVSGPNTAPTLAWHYNNRLSGGESGYPTAPSADLRLHSRVRTPSIDVAAATKSLRLQMENLTVGELIPRLGKSASPLDEPSAWMYLKRSGGKPVPTLRLTGPKDGRVLMIHGEPDNVDQFADEVRALDRKPSKPAPKGKAPL